MSWESLLIGVAVASIAWMLVAALWIWRSRSASQQHGHVIERLQTELLRKINELPAEDLDQIREYIGEINALEERASASERRDVGSEAGDPLLPDRV
jgi:Flp pilus assembly protein TadB